MTDQRKRLRSAVSNVKRPKINLSYAYVYVTALIGAIIVAPIAAIHYGLLSLSASVTVSLNLGPIVQLLAAFLAFIFIIVTTAAVMRVVGAGYTRGFVRVLLVMMHRFSLDDLDQRKAAEESGEQSE